LAARRLDLQGRGLEALDLPGDRDLQPIMLLHDGLGSVALWRDFPSSLRAATKRRVLAFSRFGHGRSDPPSTPRSPAFFEEEALEVLPEILAQLAVEHPVLVGHSDGASIALLHAEAHPVTGLALLAPHVMVEELTLAGVRAARRDFTSGNLRRRMAHHHADPDLTFAGWCDVWLDPAFREWSIEERLSAIEAPILLVQGVDDPYGTLEQLDRIEASVRGCVERLVVPGGHAPHLEHPDQVQRAVADFASALP
jgi:pimeloyl-ACP methyl ester carboxylesterase